MLLIIVSAMQRLTRRNTMQIFILGSQIAWITSPTNLGATSWSTGIVYFTEGCLIAFVVRHLLPLNPLG